MSDTVSKYYFESLKTHLISYTWVSESTFLSNCFNTIESGYISLTLELRVKRLRRFDLSPADLDHAMVRVGDSAQVVVVTE